MARTDIHCPHNRRWETSGWRLLHHPLDHTPVTRRGWWASLGAVWRFGRAFCGRYRLCRFLGYSRRDAWQSAKSVRIP